MKKLLFLLIALVFFIMNGCQEKYESNEDVATLKDELKAIYKDLCYPNLSLAPCNPNNEYDNWGEALFTGIIKVRDSHALVDKDNEEFQKELKKVIPQEFLFIDTKGVDIMKVSLIFNDFLDIYINRNIFEAISISQKMEDHISRARMLSDADKAYLLKMVSILRYSTFFVYDNSKLADGSFEKCWKRKLQEMEDSGFFTQLVCVTSWPVCFGAMLADCALEEVQDHIIN